MNKTILKGILLTYGAYVAVDMFCRITKENKPILQSFLEASLIPFHVAGTVAQIAVSPSKYGTACHIINQMAHDLFDPASPVAEDIETGYDALVLLARDTGFNTSVAPEFPQPRANNPEIVQQADRPASGVGYGLPQVS